MNALRTGVLVAVVAIFSMACTSTGGSQPSSRPSAPASVAPSVVVATARPTATPQPDRLTRPTPLPANVTCPSDHACLGPLQAGSHESESFRPAFTFTVPDGWANLEYSGGYFELVASDDPGDAILFYARPRPRNPDGSRVSGTFRTPKDVATWLAANPDLSTTAPKSVKVGRQSGVTIDVTTAPDTTQHASGCEVKACVDFFHGQDAAPTWQWDLGVASSERMRLYLLQTGDDLVAIAVDSLDGTTFDQLNERADAILDSVRFETVSG